MKIETLKLKDLTPYEKNAKEHPQKQVEQIKESIQRFGMNDPIAVWGKKNIIVEGHGRFLACKELGIEEVPCIRLDHMTDVERREYTLIHNKTTMNSDFDFGLLEDELKAIKEEDLNIDMSSFDFVLPEEETGEAKDDDFEPEIPEEPQAQYGDIYQLGNHRLMCGDSTKKEQIKLLMNSQLADMIFTDPPYGMGLDTDFSSMKNHLDFAKEKGFSGGKKYEQGIVDEFKPELIQTIFENFGYCKEIFLWGADYFAELLQDRNEGSWIVWDKRANGNDDVEEDYSSDKMYGSCFELCWSKNKHKRDIARVKWAGVFGTEQEPDKKRWHPTQKPIKLTSWFISRYSKEKDLVVDLFGGSGSTLIACEQLHRVCYSMELDPKYVDVIIARYEKLTGKKAVKL